MTKYNTTNLFDNLKDALSTKEGGESPFKDFMKFEVDKTYIVRLLPNFENTKLTRFKYYQHLFKSSATTKLVSCLCPHTYGEKCPIDEYRSKAYASKNETLIEQCRPLVRNEKWLYCAYVIKDPTNPENQGQVKIINAGKQLQNIIQSAIDGDDAQEFGADRIFNLSPEGCNLKIKVDKGGVSVIYSASKFMSPSEIEGLDDADEIYSQFKSLDTIYTQKSYDEIKSLLDKHFLGSEEINQQISNETNSTVEDVQDDVVITPKAVSSETLSEQDKKMRDILNDL